MKTFQSGYRPVASVIVVLLAACLSSAAFAFDAGCVDAVNRVQNAVTSEAYALKDERQAACELASLPQESRAGKPATIAAIAGRRFEGAMKETAAAYAGARAAGCDVSRIERPEVVMPHGNYDENQACFLRLQSAFFDSEIQSSLGNRPAFDAAYARYQATKLSCNIFLEHVDCAAIRIKGEELPPVVETPPTVPDDVKPQCRAAYLQVDAAEREMARTQKHVEQLRPGFAAAGPRGYEMMKVAMANRDKATQNRYYARQELRSCEGKAQVAGTPKPSTPVQPGKASCDANARAAFAAISGSWKSIAIGPNITIGGSCEDATATEKYAEYCERPDATYNATLARYEARFTGTMQGASLSLVPAKDSKDTRSGTCSVDAQGILACSGIPCGVHAKKQ